MNLTQFMGATFKLTNMSTGEIILTFGPWHVIVAGLIILLILFGPLFVPIFISLRERKLVYQPDYIPSEKLKQIGVGLYRFWCGMMLILVCAVLIGLGFEKIKDGDTPAVIFFYYFVISALLVAVVITEVQKSITLPPFWPQKIKR
ncbi:MAG: hypothetical protein WCP93_03785 [Candidatus Berkelbacteria bacterium]